jgi:hypothetical protein
VTTRTVTIPKQRRKPRARLGDLNDAQLAVLNRLDRLKQPSEPLDRDYVAGERYWDALNALNGDDN